jgi:hypothetical protein
VAERARIFSARSLGEREGKASIITVAAVLLLALLREVSVAKHRV